MKETLICSLEKHNIYYISGPNFGFYISIPYKEYLDTNITIRLKSNYQTYNLNKNSLDIVTNELINYYKNIDNYNITLILPVFYDDILNRIRIVNDIELFQKVDNYLGNIFNMAHEMLTKNGIKVNSNIYVINNDSFKRFTNWFVARYNNRIEYKTILELVKQSDNFNTYDVVETPNINFVIGKNTEPTLDKTIELEVETFDNFAKKMDEKNTSNKVRGENAGYVSYILLGIITFAVSITMLLLLIG